MRGFKLSAAQRTSLVHVVRLEGDQANALLADTEYWIDTFKAFRICTISDLPEVRKTISEILSHAKQLKILLERTLYASLPLEFPLQDKPSADAFAGGALRYRLMPAKPLTLRDADAPPRQQQIIDQITQIVVAAQAASDDLKYKRVGKPRDQFAMWFTNEIARTYFKHTGKKPGKSKYHEGPFARFLSLCFEIAGEPRSDIGNLIVKAIPKRASLHQLRMERIAGGDIHEFSDNNVTK